MKVSTSVFVFFITEKWVFYSMRLISIALEQLIIAPPTPAGLTVEIRIDLYLWVLGKATILVGRVSD